MTLADDLIATMTPEQRTEFEERKANHVPVSQEELDRRRREWFSYEREHDGTLEVITRSGRFMVIR
jgi:hypothetical protein